MKPHPKKIGRGKHYTRNLTNTAEIRKSTTTNARCPHYTTSQYSTESSQYTYLDPCPQNPIPIISLLGDSNGVLHLQGPVLRKIVTEPSRST